MDDKEALLNAYDRVKLLVQDATFLLSNFQNDYRPKSEIEKEIREKISEEIKTIIADSLNTANFIGEVFNADDDEIELQYFLKEELEA